MYTVGYGGGGARTPPFHTSRLGFSGPLIRVQNFFRQIHSFDPISFKFSVISHYFLSEVSAISLFRYLILFKFVKCVFNYQC